MKKKTVINDRVSNILKTQNLIQKKDKYWKVNNKSIILKKLSLGFLGLGVLAVPLTSFYITSSFNDNSQYLSKHIEPPPPPIDYLAIANAIVDYNPTLDVSKTNLAKIRPSKITNSMLNVNNIKLDLTNVLNVDQSLISFAVEQNSAIDTDGTLNINLLYNNFKSNHVISLKGLDLKPILKVILNPIPTITVNQGGTIELRAEAIIENKATTSIAYSWEYYNKSSSSWIELSNSSYFNGVKTSKLIISNIRLDDNTKYRCKITSSDTMVETTESDIIVNKVNKPIAEQIVEKNKTIKITDVTLKAKLPSEVTTSDLTTTNVIFNTDGITDYQASLLTFSQVSNANDFDGTLQLNISYNGNISNIPVFLSGFKTKQKFNYVSVTLKTSGNTLQNEVNILASNINSKMNKSYLDLFTIKDVITGKEINTSDAISSVTDQISFVNDKYKLSLTVGLKENYVTSSETTFSATSNSNALIYKNYDANGNWNNFDLGNGLGNLVYVNGNIAQTLNNNTSSYSIATLMRPDEPNFPEYSKATFVKTKTVVQDVNNKANLFFLNEYARDPFQHEQQGTKVNFAILYKLTFSSSGTPVATKIVNLDRQNRSDPVLYSYINSSAMALDSINNKLYIFPPKILGTHSNVLMVSNPASSSTITHVNISNQNFYSHTSLSTSDVLYIKEAKIVASNVDNNGNKIQVLGMGLIKENESTKNLYFSAIKLDSFDTTKNWYSINSINTTKTENNFYLETSNNISFVDQINYVNNNQMLFVSVSLNNRRMLAIRVTIDNSTKNLASLKIKDQQLSSQLNNSTLSMTVTKDMKIWAGVDNKIYPLDGKLDNGSFSTSFIINTNPNLFVNEKVTSLFIDNTNRLIVMTNYRNKLAYNATDGTFIENLRPFA